MDFFGLFLGIFGRLLFGDGLVPASAPGVITAPTKEGAQMDPDG